ncbi:MAG: hypothetical protein PUE68_08040 [Kiritimatiellae bacterium]|nr:hypothetical protein [Kiritimatiellia bacterium]
MRRFLFSMAVLAGASLQAADDTVSVYYEGRLLNAAGAVQTSRTKSATAAVYLAADGTDAYSTTEFTLRTDADGHFAQMVGNLRVPSEQAVFWLGVTPQGGDEIRPRMRVTPAPYAISAVHAARVESDTLSGEGRVDVASATVRSPLSADSLHLAGPVTVSGGASGFKGYVVDSLSFGADAAFDALRANHPGNLTFDWNSFSADKSLSLDKTSGFFSTDYNQDGEIKIAADDDGFAVVLCRCYRGKGNDSVADYEVRMSIENGDFNVMDNRQVATSGGDWAVRAWTVPVRKGKTLRVWCKTHRGSTAYDVKAYVKVAMVYVGANP